MVVQDLLADRAVEVAEVRILVNDNCISFCSDFILSQIIGLCLFPNEARVMVSDRVRNPCSGKAPASAPLRYGHFSMRLLPATLRYTQISGL